MAEGGRTTGGRVGEDANASGDRLGRQGAGGSSQPDPIATLGETVEDLKGAAVDLKGAALSQGKALFESAKGQATSFVDERKNIAAQSVADLAQSLRDTGRTFEERPNIQAFVGSAADGLEQLAGSIRERSFAEIYSEVEAYARRSPLAVAAGAAAAGFLLARFIKSSAEDLAEQSATAKAARRRRPAAADLDA